MYLTQNGSGTVRLRDNSHETCKDKMIPAVLILVLLVIWEAAVDLLHIPLYVLPSPLEVVKALFTEGTELLAMA